MVSSDELIQLLTPPVPNTAPLKIWNVVKDPRPEVDSLIRKVISHLSLQTIISEAFPRKKARCELANLPYFSQSAYMKILMYAVRLPEFTSIICKADIFWDGMRLFLEEDMYCGCENILWHGSDQSTIMVSRNVGIRAPIYVMLEHIMMNLKKKHQSLLIDSGIIQAVLRDLNSYSGIILHDRKAILSSGMCCLILNLGFDDSTIQFLREECFEAFALLNQEAMDYLIRSKYCTKPRKQMIEQCGYGCCHECGKSESKLQRCSRCQSVFYCSRKCQKRSWKKHKKHCRLLS